MGEQLLTIILFDFEQRKIYFLKLGSVPLVVILRNNYTSFKHINFVIHLILYTQVKNGIALQYVDFCIEKYRFRRPILKKCPFFYNITPPQVFA